MTRPAPPPTLAERGSNSEIGQCSRSTASTAAQSSFSVQPISLRSRTLPMASSSTSSATPATRASGWRARTRTAPRHDPAAGSSLSTPRSHRRREAGRAHFPYARRMLGLYQTLDRQGTVSRLSTPSRRGSRRGAQDEPRGPEPPGIAPTNPPGPRPSTEAHTTELDRDQPSEGHHQPRRRTHPWWSRPWRTPSAHITQNPRDPRHQEPTGHAPRHLRVQGAGEAKRPLHYWWAKLVAMPCSVDS
jgi:hypothetical protein